MPYKNKEDKKKNNLKWCEANKEYHKNYDKEWRKNNKVKISETNKKQRDLNKDKNKNYQKDYGFKNKEKLKIYAKNYREANKNKRNLKEKQKRNKSYLYKLITNIRNRISISFKVNKINKNSNTIKILGCTFQEFKEHIENQFEPWMNWNNYGVYKPGGERTWNIDHIIPVASGKTEGEVIELNHHLNLRPLCSKENLDKRDKI